MKEKKVRKFVIAPFLYIDQYEKWINNLARQGLYAVKSNWLFITFKKAEPSHKYMRVNIGQSSIDTLSRTNKNRQNRKPKLEFGYTYYDDERQCPPRSDKEKTILAKQCRKGMWSVIWLTFIFLMVFVLGFEKYNEPRVYANMLAAFTELSSVFIMIVYIPVCIRKILEHRRLVRYYKGKSDSVVPPSRRNFPRDRIIITVVLLLAFFIPAQHTMHTTGVSSASRNIAEQEFSDNFISYELIDNQKIKDSEYFTGEYSIDYTKSASLAIMPYGYNIEYISKNGLKEMAYISYAKIHYNGIMDKCYDSFIEDNDNEDITTATGDYFDKIAYYRIEGELHLFMMNNREGVYIEYAGDNSVEDIIDKINIKFMID